MTIKEELTKRVKNGERRDALLSYARTYRLKTIDEMKGRVEYHINKYQKLLASDRFHGTIKHKRKEYAKKLEYFKEVKQLMRRL